MTRTANGNITVIKRRFASKKVYEWGVVVFSLKNFLNSLLILLINYYQMLLSINMIDNLKKAISFHGGQIFSIVH